MRSLSHRGVQVVVLLTIYLLCASILPLKAHQGLYTASMFIKDLLVLLLPITVGVFIADAVSSFQKSAPLFILALILFEGLSNLSSVWFAYLGGHLVSDFLPAIPMAEPHSEFSALWRLPFVKPTWWSPEKGTLFGLFLGCIAAVSKQNILVQAVRHAKNTAQWILTRIFSRLIPFFVLGFVARMYKTQLLQHMFSHYGSLLGWLILLLGMYIGFLFLIGNGASLARAFRDAKNLAPAGWIAFSSGCSLSTMPWTIAATAKNLKNPEFAQAVIPATTNIQQIGDCIANTFLCFLIYKHFYGSAPDLTVWLGFSVVFVLARFATAAVIGGAIFIMLPIYESHLSFNAEMIAIILAFNVLLDPLITSSNVIANGALCRIFEIGWHKILKSKKVSQRKT